MLFLRAFTKEPLVLIFLILVGVFCYNFGAKIDMRFCPVVVFRRVGLMPSLILCCIYKLKT